MAVRIQRQRTRGWKMPDGAVYVGRPTVFGNPFIPGRYFMRGDPYPRSAGAFGMLWCECLSDNARSDPRVKRLTVEDAVEWYRWLVGESPSIRAALPGLRGKDLACWCALGKPCHADVLLELANKGANGNH